MLRISLPSVFFALFSSLANGEAGFWPLNSSKIPQSVAASAAATFQITTLGGRWRSYSLDALNELSAKLLKMEASGSLGKSERRLVERQISACVRAKSSECQLLLEFGNSTAFSINGQTATVFHAVESFLRSLMETSANQSKSPAEKFRILQDAVIPAVVVSEELGDHYVEFKMAKVFSEVLQAIANGEAVPVPLDAVLLSSKMILKTKDLRPTSKNPDIGSQVFIVGYPKSTTDRLQLASAPDADGGRRVSIGKNLGFKVGYIRQGRDPLTLSPELIAFFDSAQIFTDADAINGLSGSPILNSDGEVIGIFGLGWPDSDAFSEKKMAVGVSYEFLRK